MTDVDTIGGFPVIKPNCLGCGEPLVIENAWMTDGCPCNSKLGCNSMNETRWRLLMRLQQKQAHELESLKVPHKTKPVGYEDPLVKAIRENSESYQGQ